MYSGDEIYPDDVTSGPIDRVESNWTPIEPTWTALRGRLSTMTEVLIWHVSATRLGERTAACGALLAAMDWIVGSRAYGELPKDASLCRTCAVAYGVWATTWGGS